MQDEFLFIYAASALALFTKNTLCLQGSHIMHTITEIYDIALTKNKHV